MTVTRIEVRGSTPYDVVVGSGVVGEVVPAVGEAGRVAVVHAVGRSRTAEAIATALRAGGREATTVPIPDGEAAKDIRVAAECWDALADARITRVDAVVGVGGGAATDVAGFVAATWLRGVRVVLVPTTLLGMVDAAVGGKTAVNVAAGKNLVGAFHPPAGVVCDLDELRTVPRPDLASGLAEVVKAGFIADPRILEIVEDDPEAALTPDSPHLRELVERGIAVKAAVVSDDLTEQGQRMILNYGHTLGHAIEQAEQYRWRHGDAVAVGMCYAAALGRRAGYLDDATAKRHEDVLTAVGLPTRYRADAWPRLLTAMARDKKARGARLRFIVLRGAGQPEIFDNPPEDLLAAAYADVVG